MVWNFIRALAGVEAGRACRCCRDSIPAGDVFGMSEGVCRGCRVGPGT